jgi:hypothetical protein
MLIYWHWERPRILSTVKVSNSSPVYQVSFNPFDPAGGIIATGDNLIKWYKLQDTSLKSQNINLNKKEQHLSSNYVKQEWLVHDSKLLIGTDNGEILMFDVNIDYKGYLQCGIDNWKVECITPYSRGFLVGGSQATALIFEKNPEDPKG